MSKTPKVEPIHVQEFTVKQSKYEVCGMELYNAATEEPFSFLYVKLTSKNKDDMFYKRFDHKLVITHDEN